MLTKEDKLERKRETNRRYEAAHPERVKESQKRYREKYPDRKNESIRKFHAAHPRKNWEYRIKWQYGLTVEQFIDMLFEQNGRCLICLKFFLDTPCVDHDHITEKVRGLLCRVCNRALGLFDDSPDVLNRAAQYLNKHKEPNQ